MNKGVKNKDGIAKLILFGEKNSFVTFVKRKDVAYNITLFSMWNYSFPGPNTSYFLLPVDTKAMG